MSTCLRGDAAREDRRTTTGGGNSFSGRTGGGTRRSTTRCGQTSLFSPPTAKPWRQQPPPGPASPGATRTRASGETLDTQHSVNVVGSKGKILRTEFFATSAGRKILDSEW